MRPLYWTRIRIPVTPASLMIPEEGSGSDDVPVLWEDLDETPIEVDEFDALFSRPEMKSRAKKKDDAGNKEEEEKKKKKTTAKFLDKSKGQEIGILMRSNHLDISKVEDTVYTFSNSIDLETLAQIKKMQGSEDELAMFNAHVEANPDVPLDTPEQFLLDLSRISFFDGRLECFMFRARFNDLVDDVENRLNNINHVCEQLMNSKSMKDVFSVILACGNYMNGGNRQRGQADGFAIDILPKLKDVKSKDNSTNLLNYVVRFCIIRFDEKKGTPEAVLPVPEPSDVDKSGALNFDEQRTECEKLKKQIERIEKVKEKIENGADAAHVEPFKTTMTVFLAEADTSIKNLENLVSESADRFVRCMKYYKYTPKELNVKLEDVQPKDFFLASWLPFCTDYKNLWKREQVRIEKEILKAERMRHRAKKETLKSFKTEAIKPRGLKEKMLRRKSKAN